MSKMEKKLALLLGVLLLLHMAQFFGADLQVKANETTDSDPIRSSDLENRENSFGKSVDLNSIVDHNEGKKVKKDKDQLGGGKGDENHGLSNGKLNTQKKLGNGQNEQKGNGGSAEENGKELDEREVPKQESEKARSNKENLREVVENGGDKSKSSGEEQEQAENVGKGKGVSGDEENKKGPGEMSETEGNKDQLGGSKGDVKNDEIDSNLNREMESNGGGEERKGGSSDGKNEKQGAGVGSLKVLEENGNTGDECYLSIKCTDKENKLIACLRVPGNESPHLSLLIQNKGNESLTVDISAPDFVQLESTKVHLPEKENKKVEVSIGDGGTDSLIILRAGKHVCNLDFKDLNTQNSSPKFAYLGLPARRPTIAFMSFSAMLIMVSAWMFVTFRRRKLHSLGGFAYQKLDVGLPVSVGGKQRLSDNEGWDESWGDGWDDEEAPKTPSRPSPSLFSSQRLASRRLSKETRKD